MKKHFYTNYQSVIIIGLMIFCVSISVEKGFGQTFPDYAPGSLIVKFSAKATARKDFRIREVKGKVATGLANIDSLNAHFKAKSFKPFYFELYNPVEDRKLGKDRMFVLQFPADADMENIANIYKAHSDIEEAYPNYLYSIDVTPNDPKYSNQWSLPKISAPSAWNIHKGSSSIIIGIIDIGVDLDHPDLQSKLTSQRRDEVDINISDYESAGYQLDPDEDYTTPDNDPQDRYGHGTHVAGIAAATTDDSIGIAGLAWNCLIMPLRAGFKIKNPNGNWVGLLESDDWGRVLDWARNTNSVDVINMSFGGYSANNQSNIQNAYNAGITLVAASGNSNTTIRYYPAAFDSYVIAVGATDKGDERCDPGDWGTNPDGGSNYGSWLDVAAPGNSIYSTDYNDTYLYKSGTSMAAPHVSGLAALIISHNSSLSNAQVRKRIENAAVQIGGYSYSTSTGKCDELGHGRINALNALKYFYVPSVEYPTIASAINDASSGQTVYVSSDTYTLTGNITVLDGITLTIASGTTINLNGHTIIFTGGTITVESGATINPHYCVKTGSSINGFYPTLNSALANATSGQTIEVKTSTTLTNNIYVPSGVTLLIKSGITLNSYTVTKAGSGAIIVESQNIPDVRLQSGSIVLGLYPSISSGLDACASGQYVHVRGSHTLSSDLTVSSDKNLKIYPGSNITLPDYKEMYVYGKLDAQGTSSNKITFTSADGTPNNSENAYLIRLMNSSSNNSILKNCILKNAQRGVYFDHSSAIIQDSEIKRCGYGIYNYYSYSRSIGNNINNVSYGIYNYNSSPEIEYTEINSSTMGIRCESNSSPDLALPSGGHNYLNGSFVLFGVYANNNSNPELGYGSCMLDLGRNTFDYDDYDLAIVHAGSNCNIMAENNYWGTSNPNSNMFSGNVDWQPYLTSQPSYNIQANSPEVSEFNAAFSIISTENDGFEPNVLSLYDQNWNLKKKTRFIQIMIHNGQANNVHKLCKDIINDYPDSSGAFFALDLLYQASRKKTMESGKDIEAFKNYLEELSQKKDKKTIYGSAELLLAGLEREKGLSKIDDVFKKYRNSYLAETSLFQKFMYYYNENGDDKSSRNILAEMEKHFPASQYTLEAYHILGEKTDVIYKYNIAKKKTESSEKEKKKEDLNIFPQKYELCGVFPNPFNPATIIKYALPYESRINISIYNIMGKKVKNIEFSNQSAGNHQMIWDGTNNNSVRVPSGVYIVKFKAISNEDSKNLFRKTIKITILK